MASERFEHESLVIVVDDGPAEVAARWSGRSAARSTADVLRPPLDRILGAAQSGNKPVRLDFCGLQHFNTATIAVIVHTIRDAGTRGVRLTLCYDAGVRWQRLSFDALRIFEAQGLLTIRGCK